MPSTDRERNYRVKLDCAHRNEINFPPFTLVTFEYVNGGWTRPRNDFYAGESMFHLLLAQIVLKTIGELKDGEDLSAIYYSKDGYRRPIELPVPIPAQDAQRLYAHRVKNIAGMIEGEPENNWQRAFQAATLYLVSECYRQGISHQMLLDANDPHRGREHTPNRVVIPINDDNEVRYSRPCKCGKNLSSVAVRELIPILNWCKSMNVSAISIQECEEVKGFTRAHGIDEALNLLSTVWNEFPGATSVDERLKVMRIARNRAPRH